MYSRVRRGDPCGARSFPPGGQMSQQGTGVIDTPVFSAGELGSGLELGLIHLYAVQFSRGRNDGEFERFDPFHQGRRQSDPINSVLGIVEDTFVDRLAIGSLDKLDRSGRTVGPVDRDGDLSISSRGQ